VTLSTSFRYGSRVPLQQAVRLSVDARTSGRGTIRNASVSGAFIETASALQQHTNLVVTLSIPTDESRAVHSLAACVVRVDAEGVGVEWRDIAGADVMDLLERAANLEAVD
jgi:hypothetical protein